MDKLYDAAHSGTMPWDQHYAGTLDLGTGLGGDDLAPATDNLQRLRPDLLDHRASLEFRILGPLEVRLDGATVGVGGPRQRALPALLSCTPIGSSRESG